VYVQSGGVNKKACSLLQALQDKATIVVL
jgi:hypothetical protein